MKKRFVIVYRHPGHDEELMTGAEVAQVTALSAKVTELKQNFGLANVVICPTGELLAGQVAVMLRCYIYGAVLVSPVELDTSDWHAGIANEELIRNEVNDFDVLLIVMGGEEACLGVVNAFATQHSNPHCGIGVHRLDENQALCLDLCNGKVTHLP